MQPPQIYPATLAGYQNLSTCGDCIRFEGPPDRNTHVGGVNVACAGGQNPQGGVGSGQSITYFVYGSISTNSHRRVVALGGSLPGQTYAVTGAGCISTFHLTATCRQLLGRLVY
jgi:hypothetical protein